MLIFTVLRCTILSSGKAMVITNLSKQENAGKLYCKLQFCTALHCTVDCKLQYCTALHCTVL